MAEVHVRVWRETYGGLINADHLAGMDPEAFARRWRRVLEEPQPDVRTWVAVDPEGDVVGFASAGPSRDEEPPVPQELYAINVLAAAHGTGVAQLLLDAVVRPGPCSLWVAVGNARAEAFYRRRGFVDDGTTTLEERLGLEEKRMVRAGKA